LVQERPSSEEVDKLFSAAYEELRRLAARVRRGDPGQTLNPTALVNEAYVKLAASLRVRPESRLHFKRIAARAMRQVLVEASRRRKALKRGGELDIVTFDEQQAVAAARPDEVIALDEALEELAKTSPRQALLVECRFFGGFDARATAELLEVSESTVDRDWRAAKAWLSLQIRRRG
jgi:RNA polymerase sigma factor (TIGR02999 family)